MSHGSAPKAARAAAPAPAPPTHVFERATDALLVVLALALAVSIAATEITLGLAVVAWLLSRPWTRPQAPGVRALGWATVALAASWVLASLTSGVVLASLWKARKLYSIVLIFLAADRLRDERRARHVATAAFVGGILACAYGLAKFAHEHVDLGRSTAGLKGWFSNGMTTGNVLTALCIAALGVCLYAVGRARKRWLDVPAVALFFVCVIASMRRGSLLGVLAAAFVLVGQRRARWLPAVPLAAVLAFAILPHVAAGRAGSIVAHDDVTSVGRISLWKSGWAAFQARPLTGWGLEDATALIERYRRPDATFHAGHFHNNWVQVGVTTGAVGLLAYGAWMALVGWLVYRAFRNTRSPFAAAGWGAWVAFQVFGLFDWAFGDAEVANQLFLWLGLALASAGAAGAARQPR